MNNDGGYTCERTNGCTTSKIGDCNAACDDVNNVGFSCKCLENDNGDGMCFTCTKGKMIRVVQTTVS